MNFKICFLLLMLLPCFAQSSKISNAYKALTIYDYFKAKQLFYSSYKKNKTAASYGLATIYYRTDNPFSNIDSAAKYISRCKTNFKDTLNYGEFKINNNSISVLMKNTSLKGFETYCKRTNLNNLNNYLTQFYFAGDSLLSLCYLKRDELLLGNCLMYQKSDSVKSFMLNYPETKLYARAQKSFYDFEYLENISTTDINSYKHFLKKYPKNSYKNLAEQRLYKATQETLNQDSLYNFITKYSTTLTSNDAWRHLYSVSIKAYSKHNLENFISKYPDYPFIDEIYKEIDLTQQILIPLKNKNSKIGYIDTLGKWVIPSQYDDAMPFSEGLATVCVNDSCFFINKAGQSIFDSKFDEAFNFKNGIAIIAQNDAHFLINKNGKIISEPYQEINNVSEHLYVCKAANMYGAINYKGETVIPFIYNKLGDFKNGYAYYFNVNYGFVNTTNKVLKAQWDWVSEVDINQIAIVKKQNKFGLIHTSELVLLTTEYDYILPYKNGLFIVVKNNLYGFYNALNKCFITGIDYNYNLSYDVSEYTNGQYFKLFKNKDVALIDANGRVSINYGLYSNIYFAKCEIIRVLNDTKYGFVDRKLKKITPIEYDFATDFNSDVAIVKKGNNTQLINTNGKVIFNIKDGRIIILDNNHYLVYNDFDLVGLINSKSEVLLQNLFTEIESITPTLFRCEKPNDTNLYLFNSVTKQLQKM